MYKNELEKILQALPLRFSVAFAVRSAMRVLPLLAATGKDNQPFWFWSENKEKHLLAMVSSYCFSLGLDCKSNRAATQANRVAIASKIASKVHANQASSVAAASVSASESVFSIESAVNAKYFAGNAARNLYANFQTDSEFDLQYLKKYSDIHGFLQRPLWNQNMPEEWMLILWRFNLWIKALDSGFDFWFEWYRDRLNGKKIDSDVLEKQINIPIEIEDQGVVAVNTYLKTLSYSKKQNKTLKPLNQVRAIFIGNGAAGKTSLIKALNDEPVVEGKEKMTAGIDIRHWPVGNSAITAHFWDFAGQVMAHSTHQFFLRERCLYILVLDARTEINANEQAEYWLEHVKTFGKNAPVMLVGNKSDLTQVNLEMVSLREKYPNIIDFYSLSCSGYEEAFKSHFDIFKQDLIKQLQAVGTHQVYFTEQQFQVMTTLRKRAADQAFLSKQEFETLCIDQNITRKGQQNQQWLLDLLDKLGVVIHFPQLARLDSFILNPRWLTYGIYTLLYSNQAQESKGVLAEASIINCLSAKKMDDEQGHQLEYSNDKCGFIIDAMEEFKLCYRLPSDRKQIIIPDLLPPDQPEHGFDKQLAGTLVFEFVFRGFLPRHVMPTLIVNRYDEIKNNTRWQQGVLLHSEQYDSDSLIQVDYHIRTLSLWLQGGDCNRYFTELRDEVIAILQRMSDLSYQEWLCLSDEWRVENKKTSGIDTEIFTKVKAKANFKQLLALETAGQTQYICEQGIYDLSKVLHVMPENLRRNVASKVDPSMALNKSSQTVKIFISYAHKNDEDYKNELVVSLKGLKRKYNQLEWWHDRQLEAGDWEQQIFSKLDAADIVILLISRDFMASDYCFDIEMQQAISTYQYKGRVVIPIIVRETPSWYEHVSQFLAMPKDGKPLDQWDHPDQFWSDVERGFERELEKILVTRNSS